MKFLQTKHVPDDCLLGQQCATCRTVYVLLPTTPKQIHVILGIIVESNDNIFSKFVKAVNTIYATTLD